MKLFLSRHHAALIAGATAIIVWRLWAMIGNYYIPKLREVVSYDQSILAYDLIFIDAFAFIILAASAVLLIFSVMGAPGMPRGPLARLTGHPVVAFLIAAPASFLFLAVGPVALMKWTVTLGPIGLIPRFPDNWLPPPPYRTEAFWISLILAASVAELVCKKGFLTVIAPLSFFIPHPYDRYAPFLWWNAAARMLPSGYWKAWKPVLGAAALLPLVIAFSPSQPFLAGAYPMYGASKYRPLCLTQWPCLDFRHIFGCELSYKVSPLPGRDGEILMGCGSDAFVIHRNAEGAWAPIAKTNLGTNWCMNAMDSASGLSYFHPGFTGSTYVARLDPFQVVEKREVPYSIFPSRDDFVYVDSIWSRKILILADRGGNIATFDLPSLEPRLGLTIRDGGLLWWIACDEERGELYLLQEDKLSVLRIETLETLRQVTLDTVSTWMALDREGDRLFVSQPSAGRIAVYDRATLAPRDPCDAPFGVRSLAIDPVRRLLFAGSLSGVMEIRSLADLSLKERVRLKPRIHWIEPLPEFGEAVVTCTDVPPLIWRYDPPDRFADPIDRSVRWLEQTARKVMRQGHFLGVPVGEFTANKIAKSGSAPIPGGSETILLVDEEDPDREIARTLLTRFGYRVLLADSLNGGLEVLKTQKEKVDLIILGLKPPGKPDAELISYLGKTFPATAIILAWTQYEFSTSDLYMLPGANIIRPYTPYAFLMLVRNRLDVYRQKGER